MNGEIVKYITDPGSNPLQFAIYDINNDGKEELLLHLPYDTCETSGHFIYTENIENTGLVYLCSFNEDTGDEIVILDIDRLGRNFSEMAKE